MCTGVAASPGHESPRHAPAAFVFAFLIAVLTAVSAGYWPAHDAGPEIISAQQVETRYEGAWISDEPVVHHGTSPLYLGTVIPHRPAAHSGSDQQPAALPALFVHVEPPDQPTSSPPPVVRGDKGVEPARIPPQRGPPEPGTG